MFETIQNHPKIVIISVSLTLTFVSVLILMGVVVIKQRAQEKTFRDSTIELINLCWDRFWSFIFLPWTIFKGLFFTLNGKTNPDGSIKRANFSMTRTIFALASFIMLTRLFTGGKTMEDVKLGPQVIEEKSLYVYQPKSRIEKRRLKRQKKQKKKEKKSISKPTSTPTPTPTPQQLRTQSPEKLVKTRPYLYIKKIQSEPVEFYELLLFLIIAGLYYFRRDLNRGYQGNFLEKGIQMFAEAYAIKVSGVLPDKKSEETEKEKDEVIISEEHLPPPPPPSQEK